MGLVVTPIKADKLEDWKAWCKLMKEDVNQDFKKFNEKYGLTRHDVWLVDSPNGPLAVVLHEGPGANEVMIKVGASQGSYELEFKNKLVEFHGMKLDAPPPGPMPVKMV
jgi:hypothetical protein